MNVHEWPLALFTVWAQMSVGAFIVLGFIQVLGRTRFGARVVDRLSIPALYAIGPIMVPALAFSTVHLGNPVNAPNAIRHLATSWLAREILFGAGFAGLGFAFALVTWMGWFTRTIRSLLAGLTAVWGLVFVFVMAKVYMLETQPAWNHWTTPAQFYVTAFLLGVLAMGVAFAALPVITRYPRLNRLLAGRDASLLEVNQDDSAAVDHLIAICLKWIGVVALFLVMVELVIIGFDRARPPSFNPPEAEFPLGLFVLRLVLLVVGAGLLGLYLSTQARASLSATGKVAEGAARRLLVLVTTSFVMVLIAELLGRFMFYGAMDRIGI